jgi:hypothetical protein
MLYNYPPEATHGNWLHWCLAQILIRIHGDLELNQTPPGWPQLIPDEHRERLRRRHKLRDLVRDYQIALKTLSLVDQKRVRETLVRQNQLRRVLCGRRTCDRIDALPEAIRNPAKDLFEFAFGLLTDLEIRDGHYRTIYERSQDKLCPFCALEYFDAPGAPREDDDHYLPKTHYPFAAANLWNLVPMGHKCNSRYKKTNDPIMNGSGVSRRALNPYATQFFTVSLDGSTMTQVPSELGFTWNIVFNPVIDEATTWDAIFQITTRYQRDVLDPHWESWLNEFGAFASGRSVTDVSSLRRVLDHYCRFLRGCGLKDRAFLKAAFFELLANEIDNGNGRLTRLLRTIATTM